MLKRISSDSMCTLVQLYDNVAATSKTYSLVSVSNFVVLKVNIRVRGVRNVIKELEYDLGDTANPLRDQEDASDIDMGKIGISITNYGPGTWQLGLTSDVNLSDVYINAEFRNVISYAP